MIRFVLFIIQDDDGVKVALVTGKVIHSKYCIMATPPHQTGKLWLKGPGPYPGSGSYLPTYVSVLGEHSAVYIFYCKSYKSLISPIHNSHCHLSGKGSRGGSVGSTVDSDPMCCRFESHSRN